VKLTPLRILAIGWVLFLLYAYPGYLDTAAGDMLMDARSFEFGDWHSPVIARLWWVLGLFFGGPPVILALQSLLFVGGAYALLRRVWSERAAAIVACAVLLFPPVLVREAVICQASMFAGFALAGTALVTSPHPRRKIGGLALLLLACDFHEGAPFAVLPLVVLGLEWRAGLPRVRRYAIAALAFGVVLLGSIALERSIVQVRGYRKEILLARYDVKGIAKALGRENEPRIVAALAPTSETPTDVIAERRALIEEAPGAYAAHRVRHLRHMLFARSKLQTSLVEHPPHIAMLSYRARSSVVQRALTAPVRFVARSPIVMPLIYLVVAVGVLGFALVRRQRAVAMIVASGLAWELGAALFTSSAQLKNSHWLVVTAVLAVALAAARRTPATESASASR
jgi:hypothetical protein